MNVTKRKKKSKLQKDKDNPFSRYWMRKCDKIFGEIFHKQNNIYCIVGSLLTEEMNKCSGNCEMMHLIPRENYLYRWDLRNVLPGCSYHHKYSSEISSHGAPHAFYRMLIELKQDTWEFILKNRHSITRKIELPWTFKEKYEELLKLSKQ